MVDQALVSDWQTRAKRNYQRIKRFYLGTGRTEAQWQAVSADHRKFNRVWRAMLRLPKSDGPPAMELRNW